MHGINSTTPWTAAEEFLATLPEIAEVPRGKQRMVALRRWLIALRPHVEYLTTDAPATIIEDARRMCPSDAGPEIEEMVRDTMTPATLRDAATLKAPAEDPPLVDRLDAYDRIVEDESAQAASEAENIGVALEDFHAYMPAHSYIFTPSREMWPASSVNARIPPIPIGEKTMPANAWLDRNKPVEQMT